MINRFSGHLKGGIAAILITISTLIHFTLLIIATLFKVVLPHAAIRRLTTRISIAIATNWIRFNNAIFELLYDIEWTITGDQDLKPNEWYLVTCNHQSWTDIPICQKLLVDKIPMLKFFLKQELIWVPVLGLCWWALDFPFMKRYSPSQIKKNPALAGTDFETTRIACEKFKTTPVSVFNFIEGTRFTQQKHARQESPFKHLLKPKAGGAAFVLGSMGEQMHTLLDISIVYPDTHAVWDLFSGKIKHIVIDIRKIDIPAEFLGKDYSSDRDFKRRFQKWLNQHWHEKDQRIEAMKTSLKN